ncbi:MAG: hypothetical protein H7A35_10525 [Planctomycetales bacterium]|nr:hypothetical protein [bacterium]UNM07303.1 MAG: hypothetical protein H7A35_10525 [Planctomycetales bacterium]
MTSKVTVLLLLAWMLLVAGCGSGNRIDTVGDGPGGGHDIPLIPEVDWPTIDLFNTGVESGGITTFPDEGKFLGDGNDLSLTATSTPVTIVIRDNTFFSGVEQIYDTDGNGIMDYINISVRAVSAQAAASLDNNVSLNANNFFKGGAILIEPYDTNVSVASQVTIPINSTTAFSTADYALFRWNGNYKAPSSDIGTDVGVWEFVNVPVTNNGDNTVTFDISRYGEYCVVVSHDQGGGSSL